MVYFSLQTLQRWWIVSVSGRIWRRTYLNISLFSFLIAYFIRRRVHALCFITASFPFSFPVFHCQDSRCWRDFQRKSVAFALWDGAGAEIPLSPVNFGSILVVHGIILRVYSFFSFHACLIWRSVKSRNPVHLMGIFQVTLTAVLPCTNWYIWQENAVFLRILFCLQDSFWEDVGTR